MLNIDEINKAVASFAEKFKKFETDKRNNAKDIEPPEYWDGYRKAVAQMEAISLHFKVPAFPEKDKLVQRLFLKKAPNQTEEELSWMKANFKAITAPFAVDYINTISRPLNPQNWSWSFESEESKDYVEYEVPVYGGIDYFFENIFPTLKTKDPNGLLATMPFQVNYVTDDDGEIITDDEGFATISDELVKPYPVYFSSDRIVGQSFGNWYLVLSDEKVPVMHYNKKVNEGAVLYLFDDENIYKIVQTGKLIDYEFSQPILYYPHNIGEVPALKLLGVPSPEEAALYYTSPFLPVTPLLDLALLDNSTLQLSKAKCVFPYMVAVGMACQFSRGNHQCNNGLIWDDRLEKETTCPSCNGAGLQSRISAGGQLLINPNVTVSNPNGDPLSGDYIKFVSPDIHTLEFLSEQIDENLKKSHKILHLPDMDENATGNEGQTATGSLAKTRATQAFIMPITNQIFNTFEKTIEFSLKMRFGDGEKSEFDLITPKRYDIATPDDYLNEIRTAIETGMPPMIINTLVRQYVQAMFYNDLDTEKAYALLSEVDILFNMNEVDIATRVANNTVERWQDIVHFGGIHLIAQLQRENENFFELEFDEQKRLLEEKAKAIPMNNESPEEALNNLIAQTIGN
jgi:hypothetical protein